MAVPSHIRDIVLTGGGPNEALVFESRKIKVHADGVFPEYLFVTRFPTEPEETFEYRKNTYVPNTQAAYAKIESAISRIVSEGKLTLTWPDGSEALQNYVERDYPKEGSFLNWLFTFGIRALLTEPNGIMAVEPETFYWEGGNCRPVVRVIPADKVVYSTEEEVLVKTDTDGEYKYYTLTDIYLLKTVTGKTVKKLIAQPLFRHNLGYLPCFTVGGDPADYEGTYYKSVISACVPHWDTAVLDNSVLRAAVHGHVYPEYQLLESDECNMCGGTGKLKALDRNNSPVHFGCHVCSGTGKAPHSPGFGNYHVRLDSMPGGSAGDTPFPTQPVKQYINKDFSSIPVLQEQIEKSIRMAYSAVHMDFLAEIPAAQSGIAKAYDREYTNAFLAKISKILFERIFLRAVKAMAYYLYVYPARSFERFEIVAEEYLPVVDYPTTFDIYSQDTALQQLQIARQTGAPAQVIESLTDMLVGQTLFGKYDDYAEYKIVKNLDPLFSYTLQDKLTLLQNGGCSKLDFILSVNLPNWVKQAARTESKNGVEFLKWTLEEQYEYLKSKAYEVQESTYLRS